jgi:hypothetical protein
MHTVKLRPCQARLAALTVVFLLSVTFLFDARAAAQVVVIGDFEGSTDGYGSGSGDATLTSVTGPGVTLGTNSLQVQFPAAQTSAFWGPKTGNLLTAHRNDLIAAQRVAFDLTMIGTEINGGEAFSGFAQANELAVTLFSDGGAINLFIQRNAFAGGLIDSLGFGGQWSGTDGTRTLSWDLTRFTADDPTTPPGDIKTVGQLLADHPEMVEATIWVPTQYGGVGTAGPHNFYFDNYRLIIPEPASAALLALALPALGLRRRRAAA